MGEFGMMGDQLGATMAGDPMMGQVQGELGGPVDLSDPYVQELMAQYGITPEQLMELNATRGDGMTNPADVLGRPVPQLQNADYMALAQQFGILPDGTELQGGDPAYDDNYDIAQILGGAYES